jgi:hypothetical protein
MVGLAGNRRAGGGYWKMAATFDADMVIVLAILVVLMGWMICRLLKLVMELASMVPTATSTVQYYDGPVPTWEERLYWCERLYNKGLITEETYEKLRDELDAEVDISGIADKK